MTSEQMNAHIRQREAINRLRELQTQWGDRLTPNYSGPTGLQSGDSRGWSNMLNAQTEAVNLERQLDNKTPLIVEAEQQPSPPSQVDWLGPGGSTAGVGQWGIGQADPDYTSINQAVGDWNAQHRAAINGLRRQMPGQYGR